MVYLKKAKNKYWYMYKSVRKGNKITKIYLGKPNIFQFMYYKYLKGEFTAQDAVPYSRVTLQ